MPQEKDKYMEICIFIMFCYKDGHIDRVWCLLAWVDKFNHDEYDDHDDDRNDNHDDDDDYENDVPKY